MKKLYKTIDGRTHYKEAWCAEGKCTFHWGQLGNSGESEASAVKPGESEDAAIKRVLAHAVDEGYLEIPPEKHFQLVIQKSIEGQFGTEADLKWRHTTEEFINEDLGWSGLGFCDGGDIGSGEMNIFCYVVDPHLACETILLDLDEPDERYIGTVIAYRDNEDEYHVLWPRDFTEQFSVL